MAYCSSACFGNTLLTRRLLYSAAQKRFPGFLNEFYDDELWWVLAWIRVYDVTNDEKYLDVAAEIFESSKSAWGQTPCGGLW